jgi:hypothetical protein
MGNTMLPSENTERTDYCNALILHGLSRRNPLASCEG